MASMEVQRAEAPSARFDHASPEEIAEAIDAMDGTSEIYLSPGEPAWLGVAGGPEQFFVGWVDEQAGALFQARNPDPLAVDAEFLVGGVPTRIGAQYLVTREAADSAAIQFALDSGRSSAVIWEQM